MSTKPSSPATSSIHPAVGTLIDGGALQLVEVLGAGGYGVVYRAVDPRHPSKSYAVKCVVASGHQSPHRRPTHIREIALHKQASGHPGVITVHRIIDQGRYIYIVMDYAADHDLSTQILHSRRYLGKNDLIKNIFLQLIDAVQYCHSRGVYHRDLKPGNILCFDGGLRVAVADFGCATTDKASDEFRTGSVSHMSPECQGRKFAPTERYSPMFNDTWSLGIILLNLATGRNPWRSATAGDPAFQAYLRDTQGFLPTVLPISPQVNNILVRMLDVDWRERAHLREVRHAIERVSSFYSEGAVFEGSIARCPWINCASSGSNAEDSGLVSPLTQSSRFDEASHRLASQWSEDSSSDIVFAAHYYTMESSYGQPRTTYSSCGATWAIESTVASDSDYQNGFLIDFDSVPTLSFDLTSETALPNTPNSFNLTSGAGADKPDLRLMIDSNMARPRIYDAESSMISFSPDTSIMHTAVGYEPYSSMFFLATPPKHPCFVGMPDSALAAVGTDKEKMSATTLGSAIPVIQISSASNSPDLPASSSVADKNLPLPQLPMRPPELDSRMPCTVHDRLQVMQGHQYSSKRQSSGSADAAACPTPTYSRISKPTPVAVPGPMPITRVSGSNTSIKSSTLSRLASKLFLRNLSPSPSTTPSGAAIAPRRGSASDPLRPSFSRREGPAAAQNLPVWTHHAQVDWDREQQQQERRPSETATTHRADFGPGECTPAYTFVEQKNCGEEWETTCLPFSPGLIGTHHNLVAEAPAQPSIASLGNPSSSGITDDYSVRDDGAGDTTSTLIKSISPESASFATPDLFSTEEGNHNLIAEELARMSINSFTSSNSSASTEYGSIFLFRQLSSISSICLSTSTGQ